MSESLRVPRKGFGKTLQAQFLSGILVVVPLGASILILVWVFNSIDNILQPLVKLIWGHSVPGVGFGTTVVLIYLVGVVARNVIGRRLLRYGESILEKVPVFRQLYSGIKQLLGVFSLQDKAGAMPVVLVEFPIKGMRAIGFVTAEMTDRQGIKLLNVLIPNTPNPTNGFLQIMREEDVVRTNISVDEAIKMIVSAGTILPGDIGSKLPSIPKW